TPDTTASRSHLMRHPSMKPFLVLLATALAAGAAGCSGDHGSFRHFSFSGTDVVVHSRGAGKAVVRADGRLELDGRAMPTDAQQADSLRRYHAAVTALRSQAI